MTQTRPANIIFIMAGGEFGGAEEFFERLVIAVHREKIICPIIVLKPNQPERIKRLESAGLSVHLAPLGGIFDWQTTAKLRKLYQQYQPICALAFMNRAAKFALKANKPAQTKIIARLGGYYDPKFYRGADKLVGNTRGICDYLSQCGFGESQIHYISNFIDETPPTPLNLGQLGEFGVDEGSLVLCSLGRLHPNKSFDILLAAVAQIPNAHLFLGGAGDLNDALHEQARELGIDSRIHFLGWRTDARNFIASCDIYVSSATIEPLGNTILEAWQLSKPVVAAAADGPRELITHGENGLLCARNNADDLAKNLKICAADKLLAQKIAQGGREAYYQNFSQSAILSQYFRLFESCAA